LWRDGYFGVLASGAETSTSAQQRVRIVVGRKVKNCFRHPSADEVASTAHMSASGKKHGVILSLLLAAATLAFYNPITRNQFVDFDDRSYILKNWHVQSGLTWATVKWSFTTFYQGNWHPLTWLSHALDCQFFHLNPVGHHYTSVLLHTACAVLLFLLLRRATESAWSSLIVAALFALHPINVESIAWAAERKNVLSMLFFLLALHAYDRYARGGARYLYWLVTAFFSLGLMAKPQIVTLPFVLLLWDYWPLQRMGAQSKAPDSGADSGAEALPPASARRSFFFLVLEKLPLFILAAADAVVTVIAQHAGNTVRTLSEVPLSVRLENVLVSYVRYLGKALWPFPLVPMYPRPESTLPAGQVVAALALLLLISVFVIYWRDRRYLLVGWFWFLGTLVPMIGIVTVGDQAMADRYAYLPFIGLFIAVVWTLGALLSEHRVPGLWPASAAALVIISLIIGLGCLTYRQIGYWHDNEKLWRYTLSVTNRNFVAHNNLALALRDQGRSDEAIAEFRTGMALHNYAPDQMLDLAAYELQVGHPREAIDACNAAERASADPMIKAAAWAETGQAQMQLRQYDHAAENFQSALRLNPHDGIALMGAGVLALREGHYDVAVNQLMQAAQVDSSDVDVLLLAQALRRAGRPAEADSFRAQVWKISQDPNRAELAAQQLLAFAGLKFL
jgi:tetratricopeptide (TPR) repeat protein